jgi:hypothetical protein
MNKKALTILLSFLATYVIYAQKTNFNPPIDIPLSLSGSFAEIRTNHFHSGIDIRTQGRTGVPVKSIDSGYVARIKIRAGGYGKAIYINHPSGHTSVYGHLKSLSDKIDEYVKKKQYESQTFSIDLNLNKDEIKVTKGEIIALSGNSGSSMGPHLHFEIRKTKTQEVLNPIDFNFPIKDDISPSVRNVAVYNINSGFYKRSDLIKTYRSEKGKYNIRNKIVPVSEMFSFGVEVYDYGNGSRSRNGVKSIKTYIDNRLVFEQEINSFFFNYTRYANAVVDYELKKKKRKNVYRTHILPNNKIDIYKNTESEGIFSLNDNNIHKVKIITTDSHGNSSVVSFKIRKKDVKAGEKTDKNYIGYTAKKTLKRSNATICFFKNTLYRKVNYSIKDTTIEGYHSPFITFNIEGAALHKSANIMYPVNKIKANQPNKLVWCKYNKKNNSFSPVYTTIKKNKVTGYIRSEGTYTILTDTVAPVIKPININNKKYKRYKKIKFVIKDTLSGIKTYNGYLNGKWILFDYDAKNSLLTFDYKKPPFKFEKVNTLDLYVTDVTGNIEVYSTKITL